MCSTLSLMMCCAHKGKTGTNECAKTEMQIKVISGQNKTDQITGRNSEFLFRPRITWSLNGLERAGSWINRQGTYWGGSFPVSRQSIKATF